MTNRFSGYKVRIAGMLEDQGFDRAIEIAESAVCFMDDVSNLPCGLSCQTGEFGAYVGRLSEGEKGEILEKGFYTFPLLSLGSLGETLFIVIPTSYKS